MLQDKRWQYSAKNCEEGRVRGLGRSISFFYNLSLWGVVEIGRLKYQNYSRGARGGGARPVCGK